MSEKGLPVKYTVCYCKWKPDEKNTISSHELLRLAVSDYLNDNIPSLSIRKGIHGKPCIEELPDIHFSISHAGGYWACAVGDAEVGLDLQDVRPGRNVMAIAGRFFHPDEAAWLKAHDDEEFFRIWACKESYVKYTGDGLSKGLEHFSVLSPLDVSQQEIPFREGYYLVLTSEEKAEISTRILC